MLLFIAGCVAGIIAGSGGMLFAIAMGQSASFDDTVSELTMKTLVEDLDMTFANAFSAEVKDVSKVEIKPDGTANIAVKVILDNKPVSLLLTGLSANSGVLSIATLKLVAPAGAQLYFETTKPKAETGFYSAALAGRFEVRI